METSKKLLILATNLVIVVTIASFVATFVTGDVSPLEFIIAGAYGLASSSYCFYFWKAKCENMQKYGKDLVLEDDNDENTTI